MKATKATKAIEQKIVVVQSGWVTRRAVDAFVGAVSYEGAHLVLNNAKNIRVWGTQNGLGELALRGKQKETVLDDYGVVRIPKAAVLALIDCQVEL